MKLALLFSFLLPLCLSQLTPPPPCTTAGPPSNATASRVAFHTELVRDELIVKFSGFYPVSARHNYIAAALGGSGLGPADYSVLERDNPMAAYPSDFDVILVTEDFGLKGGTEALRDHPLVKSVTPQRKVTRTIHEYDEEEVEEEGDMEESDRWTKGKRRLNFGSSSFWHSVGRHSSRRLLRAVPRQITAILQVSCIS